VRDASFPYAEIRILNFLRTGRCGTHTSLRISSFCQARKPCGENTKMSYFRAKMDYSGPNLDYISCALNARSNMKITAPSPFLRSSPHPKISGMTFFFYAFRVTFSSSFFLLRAKKILGSPSPVSPFFFREFR